MKLFAVLLKNGEEWIMDHAVQETGKLLDIYLLVNRVSLLETLLKSHNAWKLCPFFKIV